MNLNTQQQHAYDELLRFINSKTENVMYCLKGYAGTGKTYTIARVVEKILKTHPRWKIAMTAPTNKAVQVLREASNLEGVTYKTIHSLLGLKEVIKDSGEIEFEKDFEEPTSGLKQYDVLVIDETSMLDDKLFMDVRRYNNDVKIIFMGDPAQIPPVNKEDCEPFLNPEEHGIVELQLTQIMRQAEGSMIAEAGQQIRDNLTKDGFMFTYGNDLNVFWMPSDRPKLMDEFEKTFAGKSDARVIAWTNRKVDEYNRYIRTIMFGNDAPKLMEGEKLILNKPYYAETEKPNGDTDKTLLSTNQELELVKYMVLDFELPNGRIIEAYRCCVSFINKSGSKQRGFIFVLHERSAIMFGHILNDLKQTAIQSAYGERKQAWKSYYDTFRSVAQVAYGYAITAHKSQGSTYTTCFVDINNIEQNPNVVERNRILYTAITRAKSRLNIIQ